MPQRSNHGPGRHSTDTDAQELAAVGSAVAIFQPEVASAALPQLPKSKPRAALGPALFSTSPGIVKPLRGWPLEARYRGEALAIAAMAGCRPGW